MNYKGLKIMKLVDLRYAKEGMIVAEDIYTRSGNVIVKDGTILNARIISTLIRYKIEKIKIYTTNDSKRINTIKLLRKYEVNTVEELKEKIQQKFYKKFERVKKDPLMKRILNKTIEYEIHKLGID